MLFWKIRLKLIFDKVKSYIKVTCDSINWKNSFMPKSYMVLWLYSPVIMLLNYIYYIYFFYLNPKLLSQIFFS